MLSVTLSYGFRFMYLRARSFLLKEENGSNFSSYCDWYLLSVSSAATAPWWHKHATLSQWETLYTFILTQATYLSLVQSLSFTESISFEERFDSYLEEEAIKMKSYHVKLSCCNKVASHLGWVTLQEFDLLKQFHVVWPQLVHLIGQQLHLLLLRHVVLEGTTTHTHSIIRIVTCIYKAPYVWNNKLCWEVHKYSIDQM